MWLALALVSATLLGFYDVFKKLSLRDNPIIPVLCLNCLFSSLLLIPVEYHAEHFRFCLEEQGYYLLKAVIVMLSWICGYAGLKNLPITIVGPINATRPVMVLIGALTLLGEHLNIMQWVGVFIAITSFWLLSRSGKKEGIDFRHNKWIICVVMANVFGALSALFDRYLLNPQGLHLNQEPVQFWFNVYQCLLLALYLMFKEFKDVPSAGGGLRRLHIHWHWSILLISVSLTLADYAYFRALSQSDALISIVSMIRRGSVIVSFLFGAIIFREKNLRAKAIDLALVLLSMVFLCLGS